MKFPRYLTILSGSIVLALAAAGCSSKKTEEPEAAEIPTNPRPQIDLPQDELFRNAKKLYTAGLYSVATETFQSLRDGFSPGPYTEFAEIKIADSKFETREYEVAGGLYEEFLKNHPASRANPYVLLRAARSYDLSNKGVGRDAAPLEKAREMYERLLSQYPDSVYAFAARKYQAELIKKLANYDKMVTDFYRKKNKDQAVSARNQYYERTWQPLVEKVKAPAEPEPISAPVRLASAGDAPAVEVVGIQRTSEVAVKRKVPPSPESAAIRAREMAALNLSTYKIQSAECSRNTRTVILYMNTDFSEDSFLSSHLEVAPQGGAIHIQLPDTSAKKGKISCFSSDDLEIFENGALKLVTSSPGSLISVSNPPRVMISLD